MDGLHIILLILLGVFSCCPIGISIPVMEVTVQPGENITLYCDCKSSLGVYILWYRNCSHEDQPTLVLKQKFDFYDPQIPLSRFNFVKNESSNSRDLMIVNVTNSDEGLYYCGTEEKKVEDKEFIAGTNVYRYGNVTTRIKLVTTEKAAIPPEQKESRVTPVPWMLVFTPAFTILSSFLSFILVYHFCQTTEKERQDHQKILNMRSQSKKNLDEDLCLTRVVFLSQGGQTYQPEDTLLINLTKNK